MSYYAKKKGQMKKERGEDEAEAAEAEAKQKKELKAKSDLEDGRKPGSRANKFPGLDLDFKVDLSLLDKPVQRTKLLLSSISSTLPKGTKTLSISDYFKRIDS